MLINNLKIILKSLKFYNFKIFFIDTHTHRRPSVFYFYKMFRFGTFFLIKYLKLIFFLSFQVAINIFGLSLSLSNYIAYVAIIKKIFSLLCIV